MSEINPSFYILFIPMGREMSKIPGQTLICKPSKLFSEKTGGGSQKPIPLKEYKEPHTEPQVQRV